MTPATTRVTATLSLWVVSQQSLSLSRLSRVHWIVVTPIAAIVTPFSFKAHPSSGPPPPRQAV
jgi:hypothetical protein